MIDLGPSKMIWTQIPIQNRHLYYLIKVAKSFFLKIIFFKLCLHIRQVGTTDFKKNISRRSILKT